MTYENCIPAAPWTVCRQLSGRVSSLQQLFRGDVTLQGHFGGLWFSELSKSINGLSFCPHSWRQCFNSQGLAPQLWILLWLAGRRISSHTCVLFCWVYPCNQSFWSCSQLPEINRNLWCPWMSSERSPVWPSMYFLYTTWNSFLVAAVKKTLFRTCLSMWGEIDQ